jgi:hypothetical protein
VMLMLVKARSLAPMRTGRMAASIRPTKFEERHRGNRSTWRQGIQMGSKIDLGLDPSAKGYYPASMEFGFKFPPESMDQATGDKRYARKQKARAATSGMRRDKKTGLLVKANGALGAEHLEKRRIKAEAKHMARMAKTVGGHTYFDKESGQFRRSPVGWRWGGKPFMRPALYSNIRSIMGVIRSQVARNLPPAFKARIGS